MDSTAQNSELTQIVHCGNLSIKTTVAELIALFSQVAPVVKIGLRKKDDIQSAFAFVTFQSLDDAQKVMEKFNYYTLHNKQMIITLYSSVKKYPEDANIFVKNLPPKLNSKNLYEIFRMFGTIVACKVATKENGESKGFGFVQYADAAAAEKALASCENAKISGHQISVMKYDKSMKETKSTKEQAAPTFTNCYVKNFPVTMTEEKLKAILEKYGPINSIFFPLESDNTPVGYACVNFENPDHATNAISDLHEKLTFSAEEYGDDVVVPLPFYSQKAEKKKEREEQLRKQLESMTLDGNAAKKNLYVSNIPETFSKDEIFDIFSKFGTIVSIKVSKASATSNKQFGYVCFSTADEAAKAFEKVDGTFLDNNKLQISYYKNKMDRQADEQKIKAKPTVRTSASGIPKLVQTLVNTVEKTASLYKNDWELYECNNAVEFSLKMAKEFFSFSEDELKEMISSSEVLEKRIKTILSSKKEKVNQKVKDSN